MLWPRSYAHLRINAWKAIRATALIVSCLTVWKADALDISELQVYENGGIYYIELAAVIDAPAEYVHRVLTDYVHMHRIHPSITESNILTSPGNGLVRVRTRIVDCILIFCMTLDRVEDVSEISPFNLHTVIVPSLSNFHSGEADWNIEEMQGRCRVAYKARMEPSFTVFPIIGPFLIREKLHGEMISSLKRIECIAKLDEQLDWNPHLDATTIDADTLCSRPCDSGKDWCTP